MSCVSMHIFAYITAASMRVLASDRQAYHPGHAPHHVTRLHRYEHSGLESMLQEEAKWTEYVNNIKSDTLKVSSGRVLKQVRHIRGALGNSAEEDNEPPKFVKMSERQVNALQEHHRSFSSLFQTAMEDAKSLQEIASISAINASAGGSDPPNAALLQKFKAQIKQLGQQKGTEEIIATGLTSLNSQYVGPIGVGTRVEPEGCILGDGPDSNPLKLVNNSAAANQAGFLANLFSSFVNTSNTSHANHSSMQCQIMDQSKVWVVFDTGSTNIWISSDLCKEGPCRLPGRHIFNHSASATFMYPGSMLQLTVQFGTGQIKGPQARDDFHIGPFSVYNQTFAMIETESGSVFRDVAFEGIVGLAYPKMSANGATPFFDSIINQKALNHNEFAFYFSKDKPSANALFWGGVDKSFYNGELEYFPVIDPYYWSLKMHSFKIGNEVIYGVDDKWKGVKNTARKWHGPVALVDTGTTFFTLEEDKFQTALDKLPYATCSEMTDESHPPITFTLETAMGKPRDFVLTNKQYMTSNGKGDGARCTPAFMHIDIPREHGPGMVLGEVFLRHYFAVFDRGDGAEFSGKIALAESRDTPQTLSRLHDYTAGQGVFHQKDKACGEFVC